MFLPVLLCPAFSLCSGMSADNASYSINHRTVTEQEKAGQRPSEENVPSIGPPQLRNF